MLRFFRALRQRLGAGSGISRYLLYAIGEIILVMIGILLALQVNNWNEERKERTTEFGILKDLQVEFEENLNDANRVLEGNKGTYRAIAYLQENASSANQDLGLTDSLMYAAFDWFDYTPKPGASNNLINSGSLHLITNRELRKLLTLWPGIVDELDDDEQLAVAYSQQEIVPYLARHYPLSNLERTDQSIELYKPSADISPIEITIAEPIPYDAEILLTDPVFKSHLSAKKMYARHNVMESRKLIETCTEILSLIREELRLRDTNN